MKDTKIKEDAMDLGASMHKRYVLIDDDASYRTILVRCAGMEGMDIDVYESLMDLGSVAMLGRYDAAIIDYDLGALNGVEIAENISALFGDIPVILVSEKDRAPDGNKNWPKSIKKFIKKSHGYTYALSEARKFAQNVKAPAKIAATVG